MAIHDEIKEQTVKFRDMDFKKKCGYIWDYYRWWIIAGIALIIVICSFISQWRESSKPVYLQAYLLNSNLIYEADSTIKEDYIDLYGIDTDVYNLYIDTSTSINPEGYDQLSLGNQMKIVAAYSAGDIDVMIGPKILIEGYANTDSYADLTEVLPQTVIDELKEKGYELYTYTSEESGNSYIGGVYLDNCDYLKNQGEHGAYSDNTDEEYLPIFTIAANSRNQAHAIEFLEMLIR